MKKTGLLIFIATIIVFATSCKKEDSETYYSSIGIITVKTDSVIIDTDEGERLMVSNKNSIGTTIKNNDRVIVNFSTLDETLPTRIDYIISIISIEKVLYKPIFVLTSATEDSIGNDELTVNSLWLAKDFLNLNFVYYGGYKNHLINLVRTEGDIPTDTVDLEIRHNNNEDGGTTGFMAFVSFNLTSLQNDVADSVVIRIKAKEFENRTFQKFLTYKY